MRSGSDGARRWSFVAGRLGRTGRLALSVFVMNPTLAKNARVGQPRWDDSKAGPAPPSHKGLKAENLIDLDAALKGRSSTVVPFFSFASRWFSLSREGWALGGLDRR